jgi:hypothetical protein
VIFVANFELLTLENEENAPIDALTLTLKGF